MTLAKTTLASFCLLLVATLFADSALAQTTYNWTGTGTDNTLNQWTNSALWDQTNPPGSKLNGSGETVLNDDVVIKNQLATGNQNIRLEVDAGTIGSLTIGGAAITGAGNTQFQLRKAAGNLDITGNVTLGGMAPDSTGRAGQLFLNNNNSTMTIGGNIVSANGENANRISIDGGTGANLNLTGTIDPSGAKEIDLWINRSGGFTTTAGVTMNVDNFRVGFGNRSGARSWTLDGGRTINANTMDIGFLDGNDADDESITGTFNLNSATVTTSEAASIGKTNSATATGERDADGTVNVGAGGVLNTGTMRLGDMNSTTVNALSTSIGRLNLTAATAAVNVTNLNVGYNLRGEGVVTIDGGTLTSSSRVYLGGVETDGSDAGTKGTLNINTGGTLTISGGGNFEVGRAGEGILNVDGGMLNVSTSNFITAQDNSTQVASGDVTFGNGATINIGGTSAGALNMTSDFNINNGNSMITQNGATTVVNVADRLTMSDSAGFSSTYTMNNGTLNIGDVVDDAMNLSGNQNSEFNIGLGDGATSVFNLVDGTINVAGQLRIANSDVGMGHVGSGTLNIMGGTINVGIEGVGNLLMSNNTGSGTVDMSSGVLNVKNNVDFRGNNGIDTFTVSGDSVVDVGNNLDMDNGTAANINRLNILGANATFNVGNNLLLDNNAQLTFDFLGASTITDIDVVGSATLNTADLVLLGTSALTSYTGDIVLIDAASSTGEFSNFVEGQAVGAYQFTYAINGTAGQIGLVAIPEPTSLAVLGFATIGLMSRRRRNA